MTFEGRGILSPLCLPISPPGRFVYLINPHRLAKYRRRVLRRRRNRNRIPVGHIGGKFLYPYDDSTWFCVTRQADYPLSNKRRVIGAIAIRFRAQAMGASVGLTRAICDRTIAATASHSQIRIKILRNRVNNEKILSGPTHKRPGGSLPNFIEFEFGQWRGISLIVHVGGLYLVFLKMSIAISIIIHPTTNPIQNISGCVLFSFSIRRVCRRNILPHIHKQTTRNTQTKNQE